MKKLKLFPTVILILLFCTNTSFAQDDKGESAIRFGFLTGSLSNDIGELYETNRKNFYAGFMHERELAKVFGFSTGLEFLQTGSSQDENNQVKLSYLSLPIALRAKLANISARAGVAGLLKISSREVIDGMESSPPVYDLRSTAVNGFFSLGIRFTIFEAEARYNIGLTDAVGDYNNKYWQLGINLFIL